MNRRRDTKFEMATLSPWKDPSATTFLINLLRHSTTKINNNGDRGQPYRNPQKLLKNSVEEPLVKTVVLTEVMQAMIHWESPNLIQSMLTLT